MSHKPNRSAMPQKPLAGGCLCGAVRFEIHPPIRDVVVCHCRQCAKWTGYAVAATAVAPENFKLLSGSADLKWFAATSHAERGFCGRCGSSLLWRPADGSRISVLAGALEPPTGLVIGAHIYLSSKSDFYDVTDGAPQYQYGAGKLSSVRGT
jgi:hypothetical protein